MHRSWRRPVLSFLSVAALVVTGVAAIAPAAQAADTDIKINEVESNGGTPGDWIEITNTGAASVDIGGFGVLDNTNTHLLVKAPGGTTLNPGAYYRFDTDALPDPNGWGLGSADSANLYAADGTTLLDSYSWATHATGTYSRCPDGTGSFVDVGSSRDASNASACLAASNTVKINEIQQHGATDWVELTNTGGSAQDLTGLSLKDSNSAPAIALSGSLAPGAFLTLDTPPTFDLDSVDSARLVAPDGTTLLDTFSWVADTDTTYVRCTGFTVLQKSVAATKNAANSCRTGDVWPGSASVTTVDPAGTFSSNLSGLAYQGSGSATPGTIWAVVNGGPSKLYKLVNSGGTWQPDTGDWAAGKTLKYAGIVGEPDAEGVTYTDAGPAAGIFVATERDNANSSVSRPAILKFLPDTAGTTLVEAQDWNLTPDLPGLGANLGLEAIAWVPDSYLTARGFKDQHLSKTYAPADYADHGTGLFLVGVENTGNVLAYALDQTDDAFQLVTTFDSGFPAVMDLSFDGETNSLWVECDNTCNGQNARFGVNGSGAFAATKTYERPSGMANLNNEGFTTAPLSECSGGVRPAFWGEDGDTGGNSLRVGTVSCALGTAQTVTFSTTGPTNPVVGQTYTPAATGGGSGNPVVISVAPASSGVCAIAAGVVTFNHPGSCVVKADQAGNDDFAPGSAQQAITVLKASTTTVAKPKATTIEATVTVSSPGVGTPTGSVLFAVDGTSVGSAPLVGNTATLSHTVPHDGATHVVAATYQGDSDFSGSSSTVGRTDPTITADVASVGPRSAAGWYSAPVRVTFTCTPHGAALSTDCPSPVVLSSSGADQSVTRTITADDGGTASVTVSDLDIDLVAPTVRIAGVKAGKTYKKKQHPTCQGADGLSGLATCTVEQVKDGRKYVVTATATDLAGNVSTVTLTYKVKKPKKK